MLHFYTPWKHQNIALKWVKNGEKKIALSKYHIILMTFLLTVMFYSLNLSVLLTTKNNEKSKNKRLMKKATNLAVDCLPNMGATK